MKRSFALLALALLPLTGCGTFLGAALAGGPTPYVGTRLDAQLMVHGFQPSAGERGHPFQARLFALTDLPLSFVIDTLLLPVSVPLALAR